jgi:formaldehyde-activating enzyme involved in methanogenesis
MWSNHVKEVITKTNTFSMVETSGAPTDYTLKVIMNNVYDATDGALAKGVASGLTFGLIGVKVTDNYVCTATLTQKSGKEVAKDYKYAITSTSGLIVSGVEGVPPKERIEDAFSDILDHFLLKCVSDFQKDGNLMQ